MQTNLAQHRPSLSHTMRRVRESSHANGNLKAFFEDGLSDLQRLLDESATSSGSSVNSANRADGRFQIYLG